MEDCLKLQATKGIVEEILAKHKGKNFFQCGKCCSIKSDAKELAMTLYKISLKAIDSKGDFLEEIVVRVPKKRNARCDDVDCQSRARRRVQVRLPVGQREGDLLKRGGAGFADVIARNGDGVPRRHFPGAKVENIGDQPHRCRWRRPPDTGPSR